MVASFVKGICKKIKLKTGPSVRPKANINPISNAIMIVATKPKKKQIIHLPRCSSCLFLRMYQVLNIYI